MHLSRSLWCFCVSFRLVSSRLVSSFASETTTHFLLRFTSVAMAQMRNCGCTFEYENTTKRFRSSAHSDKTEWKKKQKWCKQRLLFTWNTNKRTHIGDQTKRQSAHTPQHTQHGRREEKMRETGRARRSVAHKVKWILYEMNGVVFNVQVHAVSAWSEFSF